MNTVKKFRTICLGIIVAIIILNISSCGSETNLCPAYKGSIHSYGFSKKKIKKYRTASTISHIITKI